LDYWLIKSSLIRSIEWDKISYLILNILDFDDLGFISRGNERIWEQLFAPDLVLVKIDQRPEGNQEHRDYPDWQENQKVPFALFNHSQWNLRQR
jgi:hypothetical protein